MIHRTRQNKPPSSAPEVGRFLIQIGDIWVEYSRIKPTATDLDLHLHPPKPILPINAEEVWAVLEDKNIVNVTNRPRPPPENI